MTNGKNLLIALGEQWPVYLAYVTSFITILIMWSNHHKLFKHITHTDQLSLLINGLLLMVVTVIPFPTSLLAEYIQRPVVLDQTVAGAVYSGTCLLMAVFFNILWVYASQDYKLLDKDADPREVDEITRQYRFGPLLYLVAFGLAFVSVWASLGLCMLLAVFFGLPSPTKKMAEVEE